MNKQSESQNSQTRSMSQGAQSSQQQQSKPQSSESVQSSQKSSATSQPQQSNEDSLSLGDEMIDPVCGMAVDASDESTERLERNGRMVYFCSSECREQYEASPDDFQ